jgi:hypothetical protein
MEGEALSRIVGPPLTGGLGWGGTDHAWDLAWGGVGRATRGTWPGVGRATRGTWVAASPILLRCSDAPGQFALPAMREGTVFDSLSACQCIAGEVLRAQVGADFAVAANLEIIGQVRAFADERDAGVQQVRFQFVGRHIVTIADLAVLANDDLFIYDRAINHAARTDDGVEKDDGVTHNGTLLDDDAGREHAVLNPPFNDVAVGNEAGGRSSLRV